MHWTGYRERIGSEFRPLGFVTFCAQQRVRPLGFADRTFSVRRFWKRMLFQRFASIIPTPNRLPMTGVRILSSQHATDASSGKMSYGISD
jgi:hypothetical protein